MKLMKNQKKGENQAVFHFARKGAFEYIFMKSLHGINVNNGPLFTTDKVCHAQARVHRGSLSLSGYPCMLVRMCMCI